VCQSVPRLASKCAVEWAPSLQLQDLQLSEGGLTGSVFSKQHLGISHTETEAQTGFGNSVWTHADEPVTLINQRFGWL